MRPVPGIVNGLVNPVPAALNGLPEIVDDGKLGSPQRKIIDVVTGPANGLNPDPKPYTGPAGGKVPGRSETQINLGGSMSHERYCICARKNDNQ